MRAQALLVWSILSDHNQLSFFLSCKMHFNLPTISTFCILNTYCSWLFTPLFVRKSWYLKKNILFFFYFLQPSCTTLCSRLSKIKNDFYFDPLIPNLFQFLLIQMSKILKMYWHTVFALSVINFLTSAMMSSKLVCIMFPILRTL